MIWRYHPTARKVVKALGNGKKAKAELFVKLTGATGAKEKKKLTVKLK